MSWVSVKQALNSTVGTSELKTLDKILQENNTNILALLEAKQGDLAGNIGIIKSIQRGVREIYNALGSEEYFDTEIDTVNPDKCIVIINGGVSTLSDNYNDYTEYQFSSLSVNNLRVYNGYMTGNNIHYSGFSWQIIEFY